MQWYWYAMVLVELNLIAQAKRLQDKIRYRYSFFIEQRKLRYKRFLLTPNRDLPSIKSLIKNRNRFLIGSFITLSPSSILTVINPRMMKHHWLLQVTGSLFLIFLMFSVIVDYAIYKRTHNTRQTIFFR